MQRNLINFSLPPRRRLVVRFNQTEIWDYCGRRRSPIKGKMNRFSRCPSGPAICIGEMQIPNINIQSQICMYLSFIKFPKSNLNKFWKTKRGTALDFSQSRTEPTGWMKPLLNQLPAKVVGLGTETFSDLWSPKLDRACRNRQSFPAQLSSAEGMARNPCSECCGCVCHWHRDIEMAGIKGAGGWHEPKSMEINLCRNEPISFPLGSAERVECRFEY